MSDMTQTWQVAIEISTEGMTEDETALLISHIEEVLLSHKMVTRSLKISKVSVVDIQKTG